MLTDGARYLFARAKTDSRLANLLLDLDRKQLDPAVCQSIVKNIIDVAWHGGEKTFTDEDAYSVAEELTSDHNSAQAQLARAHRALRLLLELSDRNDYESYRAAVRELAASGLPE